MNKLLLNLILHRSKPNKDQGFSLFEVTISILVSSAFLMGTLQAMTINAFMQIKSERQSQANFWIQQDVEKLQAAASGMNIDTYQLADGETETEQEKDLRELLNPTNMTKKQLCYRFGNSTTRQNRRFGADFVKMLDKQLEDDKYSDGTENTNTKSDPAITASTVFSSAQDFKQFKTDGDGNVLYTNGQPVLNDQKDSVQTTKKVVVQVVRNGSDDSTASDFDNNILNKNYRLVRLITVDRSTRYDVLQIYYRVGEPYDSTDTTQKDQDNDKLRDDEPDHKSIIAENYTEVIPAAVAECGF